MNKYFQQGLLTVMLISLVACGGGGSGGSKKSSSSANSVVPSSTSSIAESSSSPAEASSSVDAGSSVAPSSTPASSAPASVDASSSVDTTSSSAISSSASSSSAPALTGVFVDSAVAGIGYRTETKNGITNNLGEYEYEEGEIVTFFIGDLELPPVTAKGVVTPLDLANTDDLSNPVVVNIARLLQSLDADGDTSNGIQIPPEAAGIAIAADFDVPVETFAANQAITNLVANSGSSTQTLVPADAAIAHLQESIAEQASALIGSWYYRDESNSNPAKQFHIVLSFLDNNRYVIANDEDDEDDAGTDGFEQGSYTWNQRTHLLEVAVGNDTNGEWGFSHPCEGEVFKVEVRGDTLLLWADAAVGEGCDDGDSNEGPVKIEFQRIKSETNPLVGSWLIEDTEEPLLALATFTADGQYLMLQDSPEDEAGWSGIERGTYTYNVDTNGITFATITDTNGQWGFSHPCALLDTDGTQWQGSNDLSCGPEGADIFQSMTRTGNTLTFVSEADTINNGGEPEPVVFVGIGTTQANIVLELEVTNTVTEATLGELFTVEGASMQCGAHEFDEIGDSETFPETWTLNPNYGGISTVSDEKYVTDEPYTDNGKFDVITGKLHVSYEGPIVNLCESGEATCSNGVVFYNQNIWSWVADVNFDPDAEPVATGEIIDTHRLTWNQGPEVSVCTIRASVNATRLP